jgi:putative tricarboxylic transport membrane protein
MLTAIDGYELAKQGRAGPALGISAFASFIGGTLAILGLTFFAPTFASYALKVGPAEYAAVALLALVLACTIGSGSLLRSLAMVAVGLLLASVGTDPVLGTQRLTGGNLELFSGIGIVPVAIGLFGVAEILHYMENTHVANVIKSGLRDIFPTRADWKQSAMPILRGSGLGFLIGVVPGPGAAAAALTSYSVEKRRAKDPSRFGKGAMEAVAGPESADNAASQSAFIPLLTLGIPGTVVLALMFGALQLQGITPGPQMVDEYPDVFWGVIASMYVGNIILLLLSVPLSGVFIQVLRIPMGVLGPIAIVISLYGAYSLRGSIFDMWLVIAAGAIGYVMRKVRLEPAPLLLAFVIGPILESNFRRALLISDGDLSIFVTRPGSAGILVVLGLLLVVPLISRRRKGGLLGLEEDVPVDAPESIAENPAPGERR